MGTGYDKAPKEVLSVVEAAMHDHHAELEAAGVTIQVLFAHKYDADGEPEPAMKTRGQQILAKVSITNLQDRTRGIADAKLVIDREYGWARLSEFRRAALIDHELTHLNLTMDQDGMVKLDDRGRPKLHMRHHDFEIAGFGEILGRHGEAAVEAEQIRRFSEEYGQLCLFPLPGTTLVQPSPQS